MMHPTPEVIARLEACTGAASSDASILGDIESFIAYCESGQAAQDWDTQCARAYARDVRLLTARAKESAHIVIRRDTGEAA
jgi:hypothetical protein